MGTGVTEGLGVGEDGVGVVVAGTEGPPVGVDVVGEGEGIGVVEERVGLGVVGEGEGVGVGEEGV